MTPAHPSANSLSTEDFDATSWHDNAIHGLRFETGDPDRGDWRSELVLDIDHIVEWVCGIDANVLFRVAPATLTFRDVTDCRVAIVQGDGGYQVGLQTLSIDPL